MIPGMSDQDAGDRSHEDYCAAVEAEIARFAAAVDGADPAAHVPSCPEWTLAELVRHTGIIHRWVEHMVRHRSEERVSPRDVAGELPGVPADYPAWLAAGAGPLTATLRETEPATPVWTWGPGGRADWWSRRMLHETTVHRTDAELALGRHPAVETATALDGIDEFLANIGSYFPVAQRLADSGANGETVHLHATDADGEWMITLRSDGFDWERGHGKGTVAVRGAVSDLLLLTCGRLAPADGRFTVFGDDRLLGRWLETSAF
jgi:uncharacterized protein (TIGR03083 family)